MKMWSEIGYVSHIYICPKCGGVLVLRGDDIIMFADCTRCLTSFIENRVPVENAAKDE